MRPVGRIFKTAERLFSAKLSPYPLFEFRGFLLYTGAYRPADGEVNMTDPIYTTWGARLFVGAVSFAGIFSGADAGVLIAAIAGATIFVIANPDYPMLKKWLLWVPSVVAGLISSKFIAALLTEITPGTVTAGRPIGALIGGAVAVVLLMKFAENPGSVFKAIGSSISSLFRRGGGNAK